jgi:hypothetical protein
MKRISVVLVVFAGLLVIVNAAKAQQNNSGCSNASLHGHFGLHATGTIIGSGDFIVLGRFNYDGKGNLNAKLFERLPDGSNAEDTITGTYSVSPHCIVSDLWHSTITGSDTTHESVLVNEGKEFFVLNTTAGKPLIVSGDAKRQ